MAKTLGFEGHIVWAMLPLSNCQDVWIKRFERHADEHVSPVVYV
jgi:hypothetical protein